MALTRGRIQFQSEAAEVLLPQCRQTANHRDPESCSFLNGGACGLCAFMADMPTQLDARLTEIEAALTYWRQVQSDTVTMIVTLQRERDRRNAGRRRLHIGPAPAETGRAPNRQGSRPSPIPSVVCR